MGMVLGGPRWSRGGFNLLVCGRGVVLSGSR